MPASPELLNTMEGYFGLQDNYQVQAIDYLREQGYESTVGRFFRRPETTTDNIPQQDLDCITYLKDAWEYSGLLDQPATT